MRKFFISCALLLVVSYASAQQYSRVSNEKLDEILSEMYDDNQAAELEYQYAVRRNLPKDSMLVYDKKITHLNNQHERYVAQLLDDQGWPEGLSNKAYYGICSVIDNADPEFSARYFPLVQEQARQGRIDPAIAAGMEDRILMHSGNKQKYGTQIIQVRNPDNSTTHYIWPVEDPDQVEGLRQQVNLMPMNDYVDIHERTTGNPVTWDKNMNVETLHEKLNLNK